MLDNDLQPLTPITKENVGLLKAGDWVRTKAGKLGSFIKAAPHVFPEAYLARFSDGDFITGAACTYIGPDLGDGWIGWSEGDNPVPGMRVDVQHQNGSITEDASSDKGPTLWRHADPEDGLNIIAFRPALSPPAEGSCNGNHQPGCDCAVAEEDVARSKPPVRDAVDWNVVGPKLVEALRYAVNSIEAMRPTFSQVKDEGHAYHDQVLDEARSALAAAQPQSNGE